jgi:hypothetical protein
MTLIIAGVVSLLFHLGNRYVLAHRPVSSRPDVRPLMHRLNTFIGICGVVLIVMGLVFPSI